MSSRREFITLLGGAAAWPLGARAQQARLPVIGLLHVGSRSTFGHVVAGFRRGLVDSDLVEARNVAIEYRWAENQLDRLPSLAVDLVRHDAAVIVAGGPAAQAATNAAPKTPVVFLAIQDPVKLGWVQSLNRPGGQMTGINLFAQHALLQAGLTIDVDDTVAIAHQTASSCEFGLFKHCGQLVARRQRGKLMAPVIEHRRCVRSSNLVGRLRAFDNAAGIDTGN